MFCDMIPEITLFSFSDEAAMNVSRTLFDINLFNGHLSQLGMRNPSISEAYSIAQSPAVGVALSLRLSPRKAVLQCGVRLTTRVEANVSYDAVFDLTHVCRWGRSGFLEPPTSDSNPIFTECSGKGR